MENKDKKLELIKLYLACLLAGTSVGAIFRMDRIESELEAKINAKAEAIMKTVDVVNRKAENSSKDLRDRIDDQSVAIMDAIHELGQLNKELEKVTK